MASDPPRRDEEAGGPLIGGFLLGSAVAAAVAAIAAYLTVLSGFQVWMMFTGLVAFFTRPPSTAQAFATLACVAAGVVLGVAAMFSLGALRPGLGPVAVALVAELIGVAAIGILAGWVAVFVQRRLGGAH